MATFFLALFWFGVLFTVSTFVIGHIMSAVGGFGGTSGEADIGMDGGFDGGSGSDVGDFSDSSYGDVIESLHGSGNVWGHLLPLKIGCLSPFCAVMGGVGYLMFTNGFPEYVCVITGFILGWGVAVLLNSFVFMPLARAQNTGASMPEEAIGQVALVIETIPAGGYGKISFVVRKNQISAPAKAPGGYRIDKGATVRVDRIEKHTYLVSLALNQMRPDEVLQKNIGA